LELQGLGVGNFDRRLPVVFAVQPLEVFFVRTLRRDLSDGFYFGWGRRTKIRGKTSTQPAEAHSARTISDNLLISSGCATVLVAGNVSGRLLNPYAIAASSMISHSWKMSGLVAGISTRISSSFAGEIVALWDMRSSSGTISAEVSFSPVHELMYDALAVVFRAVMSGEMCVVPSG
jgi:hypothetical protein